MVTEDDRRIIAGYSLEMLNCGISDLGRSVMAGTAGQWEKDRLEALRAERAARIEELEPEEQKAA